MVSVKLLLFASLREAANGVKELAVELEQSCWRDAKHLKTVLLEHLNSLLRDSPPNPSRPDLQLPDVDSLMLAINEQYVQDGSMITIRNQDILALIPPVCGG